jgi:hypothetical protein
MQKTGAGVAYQGDAALPASDLERWANPIGHSHYAPPGRAL